MSKKIIIATRQTQLAIIQAELVKQKLLIHSPKLKVELLPTTTIGDIKKDVALSDIGGKALFAKELQALVIKKQADLAVHSVKDLAAVTLPELKLAALLPREDPRDVLISANNLCLEDLPRQAIIGTASPRRRAQLLYHRPDLNITLIRGKLETRLRKLREAQYDAIILAAAGLKRLGLQDQITEYFAEDFIIPAIGQGAIGVECRSDDRDTQELLACINHEPTSITVGAERAVNAKLHGDCFTPIAAHAVLEQNKITLSARLGSLDGKEMLEAKLSSDYEQATSLGRQVAQSLLDQNGANLL